MASVRYYTLKTEAGEAHLKISLRTQIEWKKKYKESATATLFGSMDDIEKLIDVLTDSLNYEGNDNEIHDGAELYEAVVNSGLSGMGAWQKILAGIGQESGLFSEKEADAIVRKADEMLADLFGEEDGDVEKN